MVALETTAAGVLLPIQAQPGARKNAITGIHQGRLKVAVTQAPEKGKANDALVKVVAKSLGLKRSQVQLASGETSRKKSLVISGFDAGQLRAKIAELLGD